MVRQSPGILRETLLQQWKQACQRQGLFWDTWQNLKGGHLRQGLGIIFYEEPGSGHFRFHHMVSIPA